jgi:hypothetical protein
MIMILKTHSAPPTSRLRDLDLHHLATVNFREFLFHVSSASPRPDG